ncbi:MAG: hypothetical protein ACETWO_06010 [Candidatus Hadarchaeaceae archaeon]
MDSKVIVAAVAIAVVIVASVSAFILLSGEKPGAASEALITADGRTILWAAAQEDEAISIASTQFRADNPETPPEATLNVETEENDEYWITTVSYGSESEVYWVPQEKPKELRMQLGQSLSYKISGSNQILGQTGLISGTMSYSVPEMVNYKGIQCFKMIFSLNLTMAGDPQSMSGYYYVGEDYRARYSYMTVETVLGTSTMTVDYDYAAGKATTTFDGTTTEMDISGDFISQQNVNTFLDEDLYVGWSKDFTYGYGSEMYIMKLTVENEELVTVPAGTFRCYKIAASYMETEEIQLTTTTWMNAQMTFAPKTTTDIQINMLGQKFSTSMTTELESYSGFLTRL